jgi:YidC/Oxa1 family membrane protein insertase
MNKSDIAIVALLVLLLIGWGVYQARQAPPPPPAPAPAAVTNAPAAAPEPALAAPAAAPEPALTAPAAAPAPEPARPEQRLTLTNHQMSVTLSSRGGGIVEARLFAYRATVDEDSEAVMLDFSDGPALSLGGIPGLATNADCAVARVGPHEARISRALGNGLRFERSVRVTDAYRLEISDSFVNTGAATLPLPAYSVRLGDMQRVQTKTSTRGVSCLAADSLAAAGGERVQHWGKKIASFFGYRSGLFSCARPDMAAMPLTATQDLQAELDWLAVKNKFFVQILAPEGAAAGGTIGGVRDPAAKGFELAEVNGALRFGEQTIAPGAAHARTLHYYVGPKKYDVLKQLGRRQDEVMELGMLKWFCKKLLWLLNAIYALIPNYGVAIIILTAIVRLVFWPITHKSTESMKKMQALQPEMAKLKEKYKDKPQKLNQEMMALYKEHKVNPASGCLPIVVQIPVFIALFTVLRSAIELRFSEFLWIRDLSEPEGLFAGVLPIPLNILPLVMTGTMIWQQRLTPSTGDPQQQKMMMLMPVVFLFIFYPMASGLVLYWSVSQLMSIVQLLMQRRKGEAGGGKG